MFTFIGIAIGLYNFDTTPDTMTANINNFLDGMKTAFYTSIIGMIFGIGIKLRQSGAEKKSEEQTTKIVLDSLAEIEKSIKANSTAALQQELSNLVAAMNFFVKTSADSRADMQNVSAAMQQQAETIENLSESLAQSLETSGTKQAERLDTMNALIEKMQAATSAALANSEQLLSETQNYQRQSLANDEHLAEVLQENTDRITEMKNSFDDFLKNMAENYSTELIRALNESMSQLNTQLQTQFGDNFKELNRAVFKVVKWQENYLDNVEKTTGELRELNAAFATFTDKVAGKVDTHIAAMTQNLETFTETSQKNISVQQSLLDATAALAETAEQTQEIVAGFKSFSADILQTNDAALKEYHSMIETELTSMAGSLEKAERQFAASIKKLNDDALTATTNSANYLRQFDNASQDVLKKIRETLEKFNADFSAETTKSLGKLDKLFETVAKNTDAKSGKAINTLTAALSNIIDKMTINYGALLEKIAELDKIIGERRSGK